MDRKTRYLNKKNELMDKPLYSLTVGEFFEVIEYQIEEITEASVKANVKPSSKLKDKYVYGLKGLAELFNCSVKTAWTIKNSGHIAGAIKQVGKTIVTDRHLAIKLAGEKQNPRKNAATNYKAELS